MTKEAALKEIEKLKKYIESIEDKKVIFEINDYGSISANGKTVCQPHNVELSDLNQEKIYLCSWYPRDLPNGYEFEVRESSHFCGGKDLVLVKK